MAVRVRIAAAACVVMSGLFVAGAGAAMAFADPDAGQWDPTLPKLLSAGAPGDPVAIANASFQATQMALQTTQNLGQQFLSKILIHTDTHQSSPPTRTVYW